MKGLVGEGSENVNYIAKKHLKERERNQVRYKRLAKKALLFCEFLA